jgi:hypothetical protein
VAHELAHKKLGHLWKRRLGAFLPSGLFAVGMGFILFRGHSLAVATPSFIFSPFSVSDLRGPIRAVPVLHASTVPAARA